MKTIRIATRGSELALWQANHVAEKIGGQVEIVVVNTQGDKDQSSLLSDIGGQGIFVKEVQAAVLEGRADIAVHSAKDLPTQDVKGLCLASFIQRGDVRDALVGSSLEELKSGATIATGSLRRKVQLMALRPDLNFVPLRGNMASRISAASKYDGVVVAFAALERLDLTHKVAYVFGSDEMIPQVGQGALAIESRANDYDILEILSVLDDSATRKCVEAERSLLRELGSGCSLPVGAYGCMLDDLISLVGFIGALDGSQIIRVSAQGTDPRQLGSTLGKRLLDQGGADILRELETGR